MNNTKKLLRAVNADAMLTKSGDLRAYLTGFFSSFGFVYTDKSESVFFTDSRYFEGAKNALNGEHIRVEKVKSQDEVFEYVQSKKNEKLAVPFERITLTEYEDYKRLNVELCDSMPAFVSEMSIKQDYEAVNISTACDIAEKALIKVLGELKEGITENDVAALLEYSMRLYGAEDRSFETIAAFGKNSSVPHHASGNLKLKKGMPVLLDFGCKVNGYCSDITRTILFGKDANSDYFKKVYNGVLSAHLCAAENIKSEITGSVADAYARDTLKSLGLDKYFTHSLGHGIGINIHEYPVLRPNAECVLRDGMVFSIEPGVYFEGEFGIRIEDSVRLNGGKVESFMHSDKQLIIL